MNWNKITLFKFQQIEVINEKPIDELEKILLSVCVVFGMTEYELDQCTPQKAGKLCTKVSKIFSTPFKTKAENKIGKYEIKYDPYQFRFGQYMELSFFLSRGPVQNAHKILASVSNEPGKENDSSKHAERADYFLTQPIEKITGSISLIVEKFASFNKDYKWLFGLSEDEREVSVHRFNKKYGWVYSAEQVRHHEGISLEDVYNLQTTHVFSDLSYLKEKSSYEREQYKKM